MYQTTLTKASGHRSKSPVVNLNALSRRRYATLGTRLFHTILRVGFGTKISAVAVAMGLSAMWWHNITIADTIAAQSAVANDCLYMLPWGIAWAIRSSRTSMPKEGGAQCE